MQIYFFFGLPWFLRFWIHSQCNCYCRFLLLKEFRAGGLAVVAIILIIIDLLISSAGPIRSNLTRLTVEFIVDSSVGNFRKLICIWILIARRSVECFRGGNCENCEMLDWFFFLPRSHLHFDFRLISEGLSVIVVYLICLSWIRSIWLVYQFVGFFF